MRRSRRQKTRFKFALKRAPLERWIRVMTEKVGRMVYLRRIADGGLVVVIVSRMCDSCLRFGLLCCSN